MPSVIEPQPHKAESEVKAPVSGRAVVQSRKKSLKYRAPKEKAVILPQPPRGSIGTKFQEKAQAQAQAHQAHSVVKRSSVPPSIPLKSSKPWPGSGTTSPPCSTDELIKHMSNVPSYLQRATQNGDNIQGKALNFGVIEWDALERYTSKKHSACGTTSAKGASSPSSQSTAAAAPKKQQFNPFVDLDPECSSSIMHCRRSISQRKSQGGGVSITMEEERCNERGREENKCLASNRSPLYGARIEKALNGFSGELPGEIQLKDRCTRISYSCPLPREDSDICTTTTSSRSSSSSGVLRENAKVVSRKLTNHNEPSLKVSNAGPTEREAASSRRGRQSPLRRILDPLLKPKNTTSSASASASASRHESTPIGLRRPLDSTSSFQPQSNDNLHLQQVEKNRPSTRQALLQLAWKGGLPVLMLSSGESDILGATVRRKFISDTADDPEFSYSIFTLQDSKKKKGGAVWIRPVSKGKKQQQLVSDMIGEVRVSTCKSKCCNNSDIYHVSKEFVLVGTQLVPTATSERAEIESPVNTELAAIITSLPTNGCLCGKMASAGSVTAILPSGIHGASTQGEPSPLIERWRSGGGCDCGGWDEGCRLSLLSLKFNPQGSKSNWEETQAHFELFAQGRSKEEGRAFSMIRFKEGLYTVEVKSSIPLLQVFAICIALLHSRSPVKQETQLEKTLQVRNGGAPTSYTQCHPPLSPVGRA